MSEFTQLELIEDIAWPAVNHAHFLSVRVDELNVSRRFKTAPTVDGQVSLWREVNPMASLAARESLLLAAIDAHP
jgi:hypothetical protein